MGVARKVTILLPAGGCQHQAHKPTANEGKCEKIASTIGMSGVKKKIAHFIPHSPRKRGAGGEGAYC